MDRHHARCAIFAILLSVPVAGCASLERRTAATADLPDQSSSIDAATLRQVAAIEPAAGPASLGHPAADMIAVLGRKTMQAMQDSGLDQPAREFYFATLLRERLDIVGIARFVIGKHWQQADEAQRQAYVEVFSEFVVRTYAGRLRSAQAESFEVVRFQSADNGDVLVHSRVVSGGEAFDTTWRVRQGEDGEWRVIDLVVAGVSMAVTRRQEFAAIIQAAGGRLDGLIEQLRRKVT